MKLGKLPTRHDPRTLQLSKYLDDLPPFPPECDWGKKTHDWGMMLNDTLGDCTCAAAGHLIMEWCANEGVEVQVPDDSILKAYETLSGYDPKTGLNDNGAVELDVLNYWRTRGIGGHRISAFADLHVNNPEHLKAACWLFGGAYIGVALPTTAQNQEVWDVVEGTVPGSWGGHAVPIVGYTQDGPVCITWGAPKQMTWAFYQACCDEAYAVLGPEWTGVDKIAPNGFNLASLISDMQLVATGVRQSDPQVKPEPNTGGSTMQDFITKLKLWCGSPFAQWLFKVVRDSSLTYAGANQFAPTKAWVAGLVAFILSAIFHGAPTSPEKRDALNATLRMLLMFGFVFAMSSPAMAYDWNVPTKALQSSKVKKLSAIPSGLDQNAVVLIPTAALSVGTVSTSYGLSVAYSVLWCHVKGLNATTSDLTSYLGVGVAAYGDFGDWLKSDFVTSPRLKCGVGVILPAMCGITPGVMEVWDVRNGGRSTVVTMNVPLNLLNSLIVKL